MLTLELKIPAARDALAVATLRDNDKVFHSDHAVASASLANAARLKNAACDPRRMGGHPPLGRYNLLGHTHASGAQQAEYGNELFLFDPQYGDAYTAISHGRMALLAYGGALGADNRMRRTQGGIRLSNKMIAAIQKQLGGKGDMNLALIELKQPSWWQFWKRKIVTPPLSSTDLKPLKAPNDEVSLIDQLLRQFRRKPVYASSDDTRRDIDDRRDDRSSNSSNDSYSSRGDSDSFGGGGGQSGGGGASGGWDNSGRIPVGAAAGAAAGLAVGAAAAAVTAAAAETVANEFDTGKSDSGTSTSTRY